uniref:Variant surface glycoprotein n=1 Tax=Trypanosoma brucei TaxID=5691 RepID=A0A1V0FYM6_9TRYP|nr:variant surface glycoprotein [Trypanosoma brucei]
MEHIRELITIATTSISNRTEGCPPTNADSSNSHTSLDSLKSDHTTCKELTFEAEDTINPATVLLRDGLTYFKDSATSAAASNEDNYRPFTYNNDEGLLETNQPEGTRHLGGGLLQTAAGAVQHVQMSNLENSQPSDGKYVLAEAWKHNKDRPEVLVTYKNPDLATLARDEAFVKAFQISQGLDPSKPIPDLTARLQTFYDTGADALDKTVWQTVTNFKTDMKVGNAPAGHNISTEEDISVLTSILAAYTTAAIKNVEYLEKFKEISEKSNKPEKQEIEEIF